jgi:hypothetical protein
MLIKIETTVSELPSLDTDARPLAERTNVTMLLTRLHDTLKQAIKLLDAAHWMQRVTELLLETGEELAARFQTNSLGLLQEWADMKGFLEDMSRISAHLEPDPVMTQQRCQSQIDIVSVSRQVRSLTNQRSSTAKSPKRTISSLHGWQSPLLETARR